MTVRAEHSDLESLFLFYNRLHRDMERRLKPLDLTLTGLQALIGISRAKHPIERTRARLGEQLGLTNGSMSVLMGRLVRIGYVEPDQDQLDSKAVAMHLTKLGTQAMYQGLVGWDDIADVWFGTVSSKRRADLFSALGALNDKFDQRALDARAEQYLKSLRLHKTRSLAIKYRGQPAK
ncbi:MarR family winged helix-turn-helix transcriptional regulator [Pseudoxanthomonas sp. PXM02]|uniref:MarR family winged helix-turn-helix transcriptional regulator n=1 Tax=Pseudoxanthomonas sp. PXM02 TaxID=2769294 RepID=UPI0017803ED8|nr:MarR family winged helix-turn-helix transcriptional regulator [Pseudoxanthomonas sp. PXM02]MBD9479860.1 winged helix-turn-helix transcriptional regulator [Pseudoxanthomonas sp. PXM02]